MDWGYKKIRFSPRFPVTHYRELRYITGYEKIDVTVDLRWIMTEEGMRYTLTSPAETVDAHIYIPEGKTVSGVTVNGMATAYALSTVGQSVYADFTAPAAGILDMEILFTK